MRTTPPSGAFRLCGAALSLCALALSACCSSGKTGEVPEFAGTYTLAAVGGHPVPAALGHEGATLEVRGGTLTLGGDGTVRCTTVFVVPGGREMSREVGATWTREGPVVTMQWTGFGITTGALDGDTFTMVNEGVEFAYRR